MNRLYYECPIEAIYMAKNFGVKLVCKYGFDYLDALIDCETYYGFLAKSIKKHTIYISKESEHIFEPIENCDMVLAFDERGCEYVLPHCREKLPFLVKLEIIRRDNKSFHMPKTEVVK